MEHREKLKATAHDAPLEPGVYLWKDEDGCIIYVGKAKVLRNRLSSYFSGEKDTKTTALVKSAARIETIIVANEYEALLLENTLIKQHRPKYNISLKDGGTYPLIRITAEPFPRVFKTRFVVEDGSHYFGPFPNAGAVDTMLSLVERIFPLRKCRVFHKRENPCMYHHIGRCLSPCCGKISVDGYRSHIEGLEKILSGSTESLIIDLTEAMHSAAAALNFEKAAEIRDAISAIETLLEDGQSLVVDRNEDARDYIAYSREDLLTTWTVFMMRGGKMVGRDLFRTRSAADDAESLETFISVYYSASRPPPPFIYVSAGSGDDFSSLSRWFSDTFVEKNAVPQMIALTKEEAESTGKKHAAILAMARQNAQDDLRKWLKERGAGPALDELIRVLSLQRRPERIEGVDIAQLDGKHPVASLISFKKGVPDRKNYRVFKLRTVIGIVDDYAAIREAVTRRYSRLIREGKELPDLLLIDGGIGQVNAAKTVLDQLGLSFGVVGLAKRDEELWLPAAKNAIRLPRRSEALKVLQFVRDETHRAATSLNQRLRSKDICFSILESVDGVGAKRAARLMKVYTSLERIAAAAPEAMLIQCGLQSIEQANALKATALLSLENHAAARERFGSGLRRDGTGGAELAAEALAP
jgi:excinuclease ABC subunit C